MRDPATRQRQSEVLAFCVLAGGYGLVLAWMWPHLVGVRGDDFGYLESAVFTVQRGWPASSQWLGPFNLILPWLSAVGWWLTGSFYAGTMGLLALIAAAGFALAWWWLRPLLPGGWTGHAAWFGVVLCPVWLNKAVEYTGVPLGLVLFLGTLLAWRRQRPVIFFGLLLLAVMNRQSAVCLLALPAWSCWNDWRARRRPEPRWFWGMVVVVGAVALLFALLPNTLARSVVAQQQAHVRWDQWRDQALLGLSLLGGIAAFWAVLRGDVPRRERDWKGWLPTLGWLALGAWLLTGSTATLQCETALLQPVNALLLLGCAGLAAALPRALAGVRPEMLAAAGLYAGLVTSRGMWWDYYLLEPALLLACARALPAETASVAWSRWVGIALPAAMLVGLPPVRFQVRWAEATVETYERVLRTGQVKVEQASGAPFGFLAWKLFPLLERNPREVTQLSDFLGYVEAGRSAALRGGIVFFQPANPPRSLHSTGKLWPLPADYRPRRFPLDNAEWRDLLEASRP